MNEPFSPIVGENGYAFSLCFSYKIVWFIHVSL